MLWCNFWVGEIFLINAELLKMQNLSPHIWCLQYQTVRNNTGKQLHSNKKFTFFLGAILQNANTKLFLLLIKMPYEFNNTFLI